MRVESVEVWYQRIGTCALESHESRVRYSNVPLSRCGRVIDIISGGDHLDIQCGDVQRGDA